MQLWELLVEQFSPLNEAKSPAEQAHEMGLVHVGWGYWAKEGDDTGTPVAKTINGQLVQLGHDDIEAAKKSVEDNDSQINAGGPVDYHAIELGELGAEALTHMTEQALEHTGIDKSFGQSIRTAIAIAIIKGEPPEPTGYMFSAIDPDQTEALMEYLAYAATGKSKLARAVAITEKMRILKTRIALKKAEDAKAKAAQELADYHAQQAQAAEHAKQQAAAQAAMTPEPEQTSNQELTPEEVVSLLGLHKSLLNNPEFVGLIQKLDKAKSGAAVNYIAMLLKGAHSQVKSPQFITKDQWKQLHKHLKDLKGPIKVGAANPGLKKGGAAQPVQPVTPDPDATQKYKTWLDALPEDHKDQLAMVWNDFKSKAAPNGIADIGGAVGQGELLMAVYGAIHNGNFSAVNNLMNQNLSSEQVNALLDSIASEMKKKPEQEAPVDMQWFTDLHADEKFQLNSIMDNVFGEQDMSPKKQNAILSTIKAAIDNDDLSVLWMLYDPPVDLAQDEVSELKQVVSQAIEDKKAQEPESVDAEKENWLPVSYDMWPEATKEFADLAWSELQAEYWEATGHDIELTDEQKGDFYSTMAYVFDTQYSGLVAKHIADLVKKGILPNGDGIVEKLVGFTEKHKSDHENAEEYNTIVSQNPAVQDVMSFPLAEKMKPAHRAGLAAMVSKALSTGEKFGLEQIVSNMHALGFLDDEDVSHIMSNVNHLLAKNDAQPSNADDDIDTSEYQEAASTIIGSTSLEDYIGTATRKEVNKLIQKALATGDMTAIENKLEQLYNVGDITSSMMLKVMDKINVVHKNAQTGKPTEETPAHSPELNNVLAATGFEDYLPPVAKPEFYKTVSDTIASGDMKPLQDLLKKFSDYGYVTVATADNFAWAVFDQLSQKAPEKEYPEWLNLDKPLDNPLTNATIPPGAVKGVEKSLSGWAKGDPTKILPWIIKKVQADPKATVNLKWQAMELVKSYGIPLSEVPDEVVPYEMKDVVKKAKEGATKPAYDAVKQAQNLLDAYGGDINSTIDGVKQSLAKAQANGEDEDVKDYLALLDVLNKKQQATPSSQQGDDIAQTANWFKTTYTDPGEADQVVQNALTASKNAGDEAGVSKMKRVALHMAKDKIASNEVNLKDATKMAEVLINSFGTETAMGQVEAALKTAIDSGTVQQLANMIAVKAALEKIAADSEDSFEEPFDSVDTQTQDEPQDPAKDAEFMVQSDGGVEYALSNAESSLKMAKTPDAKKYWGKVVASLKAMEAVEKGVAPDTTVQNDSSQDPESIVKGTMADMGLVFDSLPPDQQGMLMKAAEKAMNSPTEFGVVHAFLPLKKVLADKYVDGIKDSILAVMDANGDLDKTPGAFKNYFDYEEMLDNMEKGEFSSKGGMDQSTAAQKQKFQEFLQNASPEDKQKLKDAMKTGLSFDGPDGGKKAQEHYKANLVNVLPGFDEDVYAVWRRALRGYHDELKDAEQFEFSKKAEAEKKKIEADQQKKAAEELQKTLASIATGDTGAAIKSIAASAGIANLSPDQQKNALIAIHDALKAPTSQAAFDKLNAALGDNAYSGIFHGGQPGYGGSAKVPIPQDKKDTLRKLIATVWAEKSDPYEPAHEPVDTTPVAKRTQHVFDKWKTDYGTGVSAVSNKNSGKQQNKETERDILKAAVSNALAEPDPSKVNSHLNSLLLTGTSLSDESVAQLRQLVQQERQNPAALQGKKTAEFGTHDGTTTAKTYEGPSTLPSTGVGLTKTPVYKAKSDYYKFPASSKQEVHDDIFKAVSTGYNTSSAKSKAQFVDTLQHKLETHGMDSKLARNAALWVAREFAEDGQLKKAAAKQGSAAKLSDFASHHIPVPTPNEDAAARVKLASIKNNPEIKTEYVKGEHVRIHPNANSFTWNAPDTGNHYSNTWADSEASAQDKWRKANLSPEDYAKFTEAANDWQGGGQYTNTNLQRKAVNDVMTRTIEGPPPQYTAIPKEVERGMYMSNSDFEDFIKVFEVGKKTFFGPSGFSANRYTANDFSTNGSGPVRVMVRVRPPKSGKIKAAWVYNRSAHQSFGYEQELVLGTSNNFRTVAVTKHVVEGYGGNYQMHYEIEMQYDESDDINEAVAVKESAVGFDTSPWKGYSRNSVKMLLKWMNCGLNKIPNK